MEQDVASFAPGKNGKQVQASSTGGVVPTETVMCRAASNSSRR
jgi:hypothetical protein